MGGVSKFSDVFRNKNQQYCHLQQYLLKALQQYIKSNISPAKNIVVVAL